MEKKWFSVSNIISTLFLVFLVAMIINPNVKGWTIQNLMKIGLFQPKVDTSMQDQTVSANSGAYDEVLFKDGREQIISMASLKGKVVFINFWATWCPPCIAEMPSINTLYQKFSGNENVVFLMVDVDNNYSKSDQFMKKHNYLMNVVNPASGIPSDWMQGAIPTTLIIDKGGKVVFKEQGAADYTNPEISALLEKLSK